MLFNSAIFFVFIATFFLCNHLLKNAVLNVRWFLFTFFSLVFYGWWDVRYLPLLVVNGLVDFIAALAINKWNRFRRVFLMLSLGINLSILFLFKYLTFFIESANNLLNVIGSPPMTITPNKFFLTIPVGLSFYTFQSMSYTIDVYKGRLEPTKNILHFFSFLSFFPQLVAGPIVRAADFLPQLTKTRTSNEAEKWHAIKLITLGYFKKVVLADNIAPMVNGAFQNDNHIASTWYWWVIMIGFSFQIYFDFSGYSDIARGLAKMLGFHFRVNFNHPYLTTSFRAFWRRWHISLSSWFRDYIFIPLGGSRRGKLRTYINLWITMIASGIWHGAGLTFILWGALHALYQSFENLFDLKTKKTIINKVLLALLVFTLTTSAWVFFRSETIGQSFAIIGKMFLLNNSPVPLGNAFLVGASALGLGMMIEIIFATKLSLKQIFPEKVSAAIEIIQFAFLINFCVFFRGTGEQFIYFQF